MATNHTCISFTDSAGRDFKIIKTKASNIKLVNLGTPQKIRDTSYYGMNASFFNTTPVNGKYKILNIAYQDGVNVGSGVDSEDGRRNSVGTALIYWNGTSLLYADNVVFDSSSYVPKTSGSWAQGGIGLFLCNTLWETFYKDQLTSQQISDLDGGSARTGVLINTNTKDVYLIMSRILTTTVFDLRRAMMEYAGLSEGGSSGYWKGILLDGGRSAQLRGETIDYTVLSPLVARGVPQIIALKNNN
ncbi:MAG TPA: hypothetical protein DEF04_02440 [Clostridiales bacterium]|nr:hypothetical protein [Clostridiales bacterium]